MSELLEQYGEALGLRLNATHRNGMWDIGECGMHMPGSKDYRNIPDNCGECIFDPHSPDGILLKKGSNQQEVHLCHYQHAKKLEMESSLQDDDKFQKILKAGAFRATFKHGFDVLKR